jgi:tRNA(Ile)-lysidine synthase
MARLVDDDAAALDDQAARSSGLVSRSDGGSVILDRGRFLALPVGLKRRVLRNAVRELRGSLKDIEARHIEAMAAAASGGAGKRISLPDGLVFTVEYSRLLLARAGHNANPLPLLEGECTLRVPGEIVFAGWRIEAAVVQPGDALETGDSLTAYLDRASAGQSLLVRSRRPGDRFQPLGMRGTKEVAEFMIDARVPRAWRDRVPVVCSPERILWIAGWRIDERAKVKPGAGSALRIRFTRRESGSG